MPARRCRLLPGPPEPGPGRRKGRLLDVTRPLDARTPIFPGDPQVSLTRALDPDRGDPARVSRLVTGTHAGTHVDAPCHLAGLAGGVETLPLEALVGPAQVMMARGAILRAADVARLPPRSPRRLLLRGAPVVLPSAARALARGGFLLVGTDGLSIDPVDDPGLPSHSILLGAGVVVLEGLRLDGAAPGRYDLMALPLLLEGCDGAPARVILRRR